MLILLGFTITILVPRALSKSSQIAYSARGPLKWWDLGNLVPRLFSRPSLEKRPLYGLVTCLRKNSIVWEGWVEHTTRRCHISCNFLSIVERIQAAINRVPTYRRYANTTVWYYFVFNHVPRRYAYYVTNYRYSYLKK